MTLTRPVASTRHLCLNFETKKETSEEVWVLLTRHVVDSSRTSEFISMEVEIEDEFRNYSKTVDQTTIAAKVGEFYVDSYHSSYCSVFQGTYTNSTHILVRRSIRILVCQ